MSTTTEGQTERSSATGLGPLQPPPLGRVKSVASPPYPLGLPHYPAPWPLTSPENGPEVELPTQACQANRPPLPGTLRRGLLEGGFSEDILPTALPQHTLTLQDLDTARHTAGTWQIAINSLLSLAMAKTLGRIPPFKQVLRAGLGVQKAVLPLWALPAWEGFSACPAAWCPARPGGRQGDGQGARSGFPLHCPWRQV